MAPHGSRWVQMAPLIRKILSYRSCHRRCSVKKVFLEIFQNSHESTSARVSFLIKLQAEACSFIKKEILAQVFSFAKFSRTPFLLNTSGRLLLFNRNYFAKQRFLNESLTSRVLSKYVWKVYWEMAMWNGMLLGNENYGQCTAWKVSVFGVFLVRIFPHVDWIRTTKTPNTDTFHAVRIKQHCLIDLLNWYFKKKC